MTFIDIAKIYVKSGKGGDGHVSFRRELYVPTGGPDGGDGGRGGNIIFEVDKSLNTLLPFKHKYKYIASSGADGGAKRCHGKDGEDLVIKVPDGTLIKETKSDKILYDMTGENTRITLLKGGKGGLGNMHFATSVMQAPRYAKPGEKSHELYITLELKVLADVGLVGFPNVGKSTIISKITNARPEINNYPFTTINPHHGVCRHNGIEFVIADIPGIVENASEGIGLGLKFLKHIERTKVLLHVVDIASIEGRNPLTDLDIIMHELSKYNKKLKTKRQIIAANKIDSIDEDTLNKKIKELKIKYSNIEIIPISSLNGKGIDLLLDRLSVLVSEERKNDSNVTFESEISVDNFFMNPANELIIEKINTGVYKVSGEKIKKLFGYTNIDTEKGMNYFQKYLKDEGIISALKKKGMMSGDTVDVEGIEFEYYD